MQTGGLEEVAVKLLEPGDMFGDYTVEKLLGQGGMGAVHLMRTSDGTLYAVKVMDAEAAEKNQDFLKRFLREGEFAVRIRHPNLIAVHRVGKDERTGLCYLAMDYLPGGSLADRLEKCKRLSVEESVSIVVQIAAALEVAHRNGVIHRDIKPGNIMFDIDGTPKLADLGVAKFSDGTHKTTVTSTGMIIGTPAYMAPEQMMDSRHVDARADIYSLGVVFYEMLTGIRPNEGSTAIELMTRALKGEPLPDVRRMRPELSAAIAYVLSLLCAPRPEMRPQTALAAADLVGKAVQGTLVVPKKVLHMVTAEDVAWKRKRKRLMLFFLAGVGLVSLLITVAVGWIKVLGHAPVAEERLPQDGDRHLGTNTVIHSNIRQLRDNQSAITEKVVRQTTVGKHTWYYTLENDEAVIWRGRTGYNRTTSPAVEPSTDMQLVIPSELDGHKVTKIGEIAFVNHRRMRHITLPEGIKEMRRASFLNCTSLRSVKFPSTLERIKTGTFVRCNSLEEIDIGDYSGSLGGAFSECPSLSRFYVSPTNTAYVKIRGAIFTRDKEKLVLVPRTIVTTEIPRFVKEIDDGAFNSATNLMYVSMCENVVKIGHGAFAGCERMFAFSVGKGVQEIGSSVFSDCYNLRFVTFPASLKKVGHSLFARCDNLERVYFNGDAPSVNMSGDSVLGRTPHDLVIAVRRGSKGWKRPGSTELPEVWPVEGFEDSRPIKFDDTLEPIRLLKRKTRGRTLL